VNLLTICRELRDRYRAFRARSLGEVRLLALFMDAIYLPVRPDGPKEGVLVAWGFTTDGERVLLTSVSGSASGLRIGSTWAGASWLGACGARSSSCPTGHPAWSGRSPSCGLMPTGVAAPSNMPSSGLCRCRVSNRPRREWSGAVRSA
jgi:hypothetical protein